MKNIYTLNCRPRLNFIDKQASEINLLTHTGRFNHFRGPLIAID